MSGRIKAAIPHSCTEIGVRPGWLSPVSRRVHVQTSATHTDIITCGSTLTYQSDTDKGFVESQLHLDGACPNRDGWGSSLLAWRASRMQAALFKNVAVGDRYLLERKAHGNPLETLFIPADIFANFLRLSLQHRLARDIPSWTRTRSPSPLDGGTTGTSQARQRKING